MLELPTEILYMILEFSYEIDLQLLRRTNMYFSKLIPYEKIYPALIKMDVVHLKKYKKFIFKTSLGYTRFLKSALQYELFDSIVYLKKLASEIDRFRKIEPFIVKDELVDEFLNSQISAILTDGGTLNHIKLLRKAKFPWRNEMLILIAMNLDKFDIFKYLIENGCSYFSFTLLHCSIIHIPEKYLNYLNDFVSKGNI